MTTLTSAASIRNGAFGPLLTGTVTGLLAFLVGAGLIAGVRTVAGVEAVAFGPLVFGGYWFGLAGWLAGVGVWRTWAKEWLGLPVDRTMRTGWRRYFDFTTDHKVIGVQYLVTFLAG